MRIYLFLILTTLCFGRSKGVGFPPVRNFTKQNYGAGSQNWAVTQDSYGRVYFANRDGLLKYDGTRWSLFHLPNYTTVRCLYADGKTGRIYVGGTGEFGYFHSDPSSGRMKYVSLLNTLPANERDFTEIWNIHDAGNGKIIFQGDFVLLVYDGKTSEVIKSKNKITTSGLIGGNLYLGTQAGELLTLKNRSLKNVDRLPGADRVVAILPYGKEILLTAASSGLYLLEGGRIKHADWDISPFLKENQAFCAVASGTLYAFGTVNKGAVVKNISTGETTYINRQSGLLDNTVLGLGFDFSSNLWLCLDNGLGYALVDSPVYDLLGASSDAGAGYSSLKYGSRLFLATNRGLFEAPYPFENNGEAPVLSRLHNGQVWGLDRIGETVFISADDGLFVMNPERSDSIMKIEGVESGSWFVAPLRSRPGKALVSTYMGFYLIENDGDRWKLRNKVEGYDDAGGKFVETPDGRIWLAHWIKGVVRLELSPDMKRFKDIRLYTAKDGLPSDRDNSLSMYEGKLRILTASGEFFTVNTDGTLRRDDKLSGKIPLKGPAHFYPVAQDMAFAFSPEFIWKMHGDGKGSVNIDTLTLRMAANSLIPGFEHVSRLDNNIILSNQEGFFSINPTAVMTNKWKNGVFIESLAAGDSIIFSGLPKGAMPDLKLPYALNSLTFNFAAPEYRYENSIVYSCKLDNYDEEWTGPLENATKEYTQLHEGEYTLHIRALNTVTGETSESSFTFTILPPWYRSAWAKIIYALLILVVIFLTYRVIRYYSRRNALKVRTQKEAEMENMRMETEKEAIKKDYEIASLKSERLEQEIKHKSSELSNTTMNVIKKNEILQDISSRLSKLSKKAELDKESSDKLNLEIQKIQTLIHDNISHDDDWKKFNQNFDIVYSDFTKRLGERHPDLTISERRLCCYLKMGLSSKEIAPIFNITPKSVEMNRYRLRQKLDLKREDNLVEYLQGI